MILVVAICSVAALLAGFVALTFYEKHRGVRFFSSVRTMLDELAGDVLRAFVRLDDEHIKERVQRVAERGFHDAAHMLLLGVRFFERTLTRVVRTIRVRRSRMINNRGEKDQEHLPP